MKYVVVNPKARTIETVNTGDDVDDIKQVIRQAGLDPAGVDHGSLGRIGYVVDEYGLFVPADQQSYFSIYDKLIAGPTVFYGVDEIGETRDLMKSQLPNVTFYLGRDDVEHAIIFGKIRRPQMSANGRIFWQWPAPRPPETIF